MRLRGLFLLVLTAFPAWGQYVANAQAGVSYPALTSASLISLQSPGETNPRDVGRAIVPLGFDFPFYSKVYSELTVTANGVLFFEPSSGANLYADFPANAALPSGAEPNGVIAPLWDDLTGNNATSELRRQPVSGSNGQGLAIEFRDWSRWPGGYFLNFQVRLWENGTIEFYYGTMSGMGASVISATVGIESPSGTAGTNGLNTCTTGCSPLPVPGNSTTSFDPLGTGSPVTFIRFTPQPGFDLQALRLRVDSITQAGDDLTIATTFDLRNFGTVASPDFDYALYLSDDTVFDPGVDRLLEPAPAQHPGLTPLGLSTKVDTGTVARPDGGSWYVMAVIPPVLLADGGYAETNPFNNIITSSVPYAAGVDLVAESVVPPPVAGPGDSVNVQVRFSNQGFELAGDVNVKLYASTDGELSMGDLLLTSQTINVVGGQQVDQPVTFVLPGTTAPGNYYLLLRLDDGPSPGDIVELSEANNVVSSASTMQVRQADLIVTEVRVLRATPPIEPVNTVFLGEPAGFEARVANQGGATAPAVRVSFYLSENETLNGFGDPLLDSVDAGSFAPGEAKWVTLPSAVVPTHRINGTELPVQPYFFFAAAIAPGLTEIDPWNNFAHAPPVLGRLPAADYLPVELQVPPRAGAGEVVAVTRTFANYGIRDGAPVKYRYYLSANPTITPQDLPMTLVTGSGDVLEGTVSLAVGQFDSATEFVRLPSSVAEATYYIGVLIDPANEVDEADKENNGLAGPPVSVFPQRLGLATATLPDGTVGLPYNVQLEGQGGNGVYEYTLADPSSLPDGLTLSAGGVISGTPTEAGVGPVIITISSNERSVVVAVPLRVAPPTASMHIRDTALPAPVQFRAYLAKLGAVGGAGGYTFSVVDGVLPPGLSLATDGTLSGVPVEDVGTQRAFVVRCIDLAGNVDHRAFVTVVIASAPFSIATPLLPDAELGKPYLELIAATDLSGGTVATPVKWSLQAGTLPPGFALEPSTSDSMVLSGTPTRPGRYEFTIDATDAQSRVAAHSYVVTVLAPGVVARGDGTRAVIPGGTVHISFSAVGLPGGAKWYWHGGELPEGVSFSADGVVSGTVPVSAPSKLYTFTVMAGLSPSESLSQVSWTLDVNPDANAGTGCGLSPFALFPSAVLLLLKGRKRRKSLK